MTTAQQITSKTFTRKGTEELYSRLDSMTPAELAETRRQVEAFRPAARTGSGAYARQEGAKRAILAALKD